MLSSDKDDDLCIIIDDNTRPRSKINIKSDIVKMTTTTPTTPRTTSTPTSTYSYATNKVITLYEDKERKHSEAQTDDDSLTDSTYINEITIKKEKLLKSIKENKKKINTSLYIISAKYDLIYFRYNRISLLILIISTLMTFMQAISLTLVNYENNSSRLSSYISKDTITLIVDLFGLFLGTLLTILSSIVKFRNYRENMEKLKNIHDILFNYKIMYNKQRDLIDYFVLSNNLSLETFDKLVQNIENINREIKDINIFENIRIKDIVKFNGIKVDHDIELQKLINKRELEFFKLTIESTKNKHKYNENKIENVL
jgi:uncharacterized membrane protein required for colicin V production